MRLSLNTDKRYTTWFTCIVSPKYRVAPRATRIFLNKENIYNSQKPFLIYFIVLLLLKILQKYTALWWQQNINHLFAKYSSISTLILWQHSLVDRFFIDILKTISREKTHCDISSSLILAFLNDTKNCSIDYLPNLDSSIDCNQVKAFCPLSQPVIFQPLSLPVCRLYTCKVCIFHSYLATATSLSPQLPTVGSLLVGHSCLMLLLDMHSNSTESSQQQQLLFTSYTNTFLLIKSGKSTKLWKSSVVYIFIFIASFKNEFVILRNHSTCRW